MQRADDKAESLYGSESMPAEGVTSVDHQKGPAGPPSAAAHYKGGDDFQMMMMMSSGSWGTTGGGVSEIEEEEEEEHEYSRGRKVFDFNKITGGPLDSIREEDQRQVVGLELEGLGSGRSSNLFSFNFHDGESEDAVYYVALLQGGQQGNVGSKRAADQDSASMDALLWTLNQAAAAANSHPSATPLLFLVSVFPEIKHIPTPLGMTMPVSQVNPGQKEIYMAQERGKRAQFLSKFLNACSSAAKVKVDTILIDSDMEAKAILDLIPILNIRKLVLGTTKAILRKMRSKRSASGVIDQIVKGAPEFCEVKVICEGKEMLDFMNRDSPSGLSPSPSPSPSPRSTYAESHHSSQPMHSQQRSSNATDQSFTCGCFKPKVQS